MTLNPPFPRGRTARHVHGRMNQAEGRYAAHLERLRVKGELAAWFFEPVKFRLADKTYYSPDFLVMLADGTLELHELKGFMEDDAAVKLKITAETYWLFRVVVVRERPRGVFTLRALERA